MSYVSWVLCLFCLLTVVSMQGTGSGTNGNLRLCVVEGRGAYKRAPKYCPILDKENSGVECVVGVDRLDCLRRISKGTVDFGVFSPEDLLAAQWAMIQVLVTSELRLRNRPFQRNIVAVINRRILPDSSSTLHAVLENSTLCHPGVGNDDIRPLSDTMAGYLESLVLEKSCDPDLSLYENRIKALAGYFGKACKAGSWVPDKARDMQLKQKYSTLCAACRNPSRCSKADPYWGDAGALACLGERIGDVAWAEIDDVNNYFGLIPHVANRAMNRYPSTEGFAYLCRDGTWQPLENNSDPCVWLNRPWNIIVAQTKAAAEVGELTLKLSNSSANVGEWRKALVSLLESPQELVMPLQPPQTPFDYLGRPTGFVAAYSQKGCDPPRHVTLCTTSLIARNKCEWLSEAGGVYGIDPPLQCTLRNNTKECMQSVNSGEADIAMADSDWLVPAIRDFDLAPVLYEATPIVKMMRTVVAYVKKDSGITKLADLKGKRAAFPRYDGVDWHGVQQYFTKNEKVACSEIAENFFKEICAPGSAEGNIKACYPEGEAHALKSLVTGKSDVAFVSMSAYNVIAGNKDNIAEDFKDIISLCPEDNKGYCYLTWANIGQVYASRNITAMRKQEIINILTKMDQLFGKHSAFQYPMFSMYGPYNHEMDVLFHNNTKTLIPNSVFNTHPYDKLPLNFEKQFLNVTDFSCSFCGKVTPSLVLIVSLVSILMKTNQ